jgi:hypothetical protein
VETRSKNTKRSSSSRVVLGEKRRKEEQAVLGLMLVVTLWTDARPCVQCNI